MRMFWEGTSDGENYATGHACYNWRVPVCPGAKFASQNYNYESTGWSYFVEYECTSESGASALIAAATIFLALSNLI